MQRLALGLVLLLICGAVSAEQIKPATKAAIKTPTPAAKKVAKKPAAPKGPPAKMLFGAVTALIVPKNLGYAGIYSANAVRVMTGFKVILPGGGLVGEYPSGTATQQPALGRSVRSTAPRCQTTLSVTRPRSARG